MAFAKYAKTGTHHGRVYACTRCTYFNDLRAIKGHVVSRHLELEEAPYFCRLCHLKCYAAEEWVRHANSVAHRLRVMVSPSSVSKNTLGRSSWELNLEGDNPDATRWGAAESERYFSLSASVRPKSSNYQLEDLLAEVPLSEPPAPAPAVAEEGYEPLILDEASWIQHTTEAEADPHAETIPPSPTPSVTPDAAPDQRSETPEAPEMGRTQQLGCAAPAEVTVVRPSVTPEPDAAPDQRSETPEAPEMGRTQQLGCAAPAEVTVVRPSVTPEPDAAPDQRSETPEAPEMGRTQQLGCAAPAEVTVVRPSVTPEPDAAPDQRSVTPEAPEMGQSRQVERADPDVTPDRASGSEESTSAASAGNLPTLEVGQSSPASDEVPDSTPEGLPPVGEEVEVMDTSLLQMHNADSSVTLDVVSMSDRSTSASPSRPASKVVQDPALEGAPPVGEEPEVTLVDADPGKDRSLAVIPQQEKKGAPATGVTHRRPILEMLSEVFPVPPPKPRTAPRSVAPCEVQLQRLPPKPTSYYITMDGALIPQGPETSLRVCQLQQCCDLVSRSVHRALAPMLKKLATEEKEKRSLQELLQELHASNKELRKSNDELLRYLRRKSSNKRTKRHHQEETPELKKRKKHRET